MAGRRMFARSVTTTGRFMRLPAGAKYLYFALGMEADDDGFAEGWLVLRMTGQEETDLRILEKAGYVKVYGEDLITYIVDWDTNNQIRKDRYRESRYAYLLNEKPEETAAQPVSSRQAEKTSDAEAPGGSEEARRSDDTPKTAAAPEGDSWEDKALEPAEILPARSLGTGREPTAGEPGGRSALDEEMELFLLQERRRKARMEEKRLREKEALREEREKQGLYFIDVDKLFEGLPRRDRQEAAG